MILSVQRQLRDAVTEAILRQFGLADVPPFAVDVPPSRALGDLAVPVAFQLARSLKKAPRAIAQEIAGALGDLPGIARVVVSPNGYLNFYLDRPAFLCARVRGEVAPASRCEGQDRRRAHRHQSQQGRARRAPAECDARRHARPGPAVPRLACRDPELHRRYRRPGGRRHCWLPRARTAHTGRGESGSPTARDSTTTAGTSTRALLSGTKTTKAGSIFAPVPCTISSRGGTPRPKWRHSSWIVSCART